MKRNFKGRSRKRRRRDSDEEEEFSEPQRQDYSHGGGEKYLRDEHLRQPIVKFSERLPSNEDYEGIRLARRISKLAQTSPFYMAREPRIPHPLRSTQVNSKGKKSAQKELCGRLNLNSLCVPGVVKALSGIGDGEIPATGLEFGAGVSMNSSDILSGMRGEGGDLGRDRTQTEGTEGTDGNEENLTATVDDDNEDFEAGDYGNTYNNDSEEEAGDDSTNLLSL